MIHPGVYLHGEMLSNTVISHAVEEVAKADTILVLGMNLNSSLCKDMLPHFTGKDLIVIHKEPIIWMKKQPQLTMEQSVKFFQKLQKAYWMHNFPILTHILKNTNLSRNQYFYT